MNATLCPTTDIDLEVYDLSVATENGYATTPMAVVLPRQQPVDEEVLHASFEEALSDRLSYWKHLSDGTLSSIQHSSVEQRASALPVFPVAEPLVNDQAISLLRRSWQRRVVFACLALMFILIGFDIMGLLVLSMR